LLFTKKDGKEQRLSSADFYSDSFLNRKTATCIKEFFESREIMPELPEVETIARSLHCGRDGICPIVGKRVDETHLYWKKTLANTTAEKMNDILTDQIIQKVGRRGKYLIIDFHNTNLLIHLRMSGDVRVEQKDDSEKMKHDRLALDFTDGWRLVFNDPRKFGRAWLVADPLEIIQDLGPEPLDPSLNAKRFHQKLVARKRQLKPLLLDQTFLAGLGNIYTDEALHLAQLHPMRSSASLHPDESRRLLHAIRTILKQGIRRNGASIDWVYRGGEFQNHFRVYQRQGEACSRCGTPIQRILVGQRGTHFCPHCQPLHG
jgi:formamidopyrimidine-DNA glycosylase